MGIANSKVPYSTWESLAGGIIIIIIFDWVIYSYDPMTKKNGLKILDLYWLRMGKWTDIPFCPGISSYNQ